MTTGGVIRRRRQSALNRWRHRYYVYYRQVLRQLGTNLLLALPWLLFLAGMGAALAAALANVEAGFGSKVVDGWAALYVTWMTMTTVGFGDVVAVTTAGKAILSLAAFLGLITFGTLIWFVTTTLDQRDYRRESPASAAPEGH